MGGGDTFRASTVRRLEHAGLTDVGNDARPYGLHGGSLGTAFERFSFEAQRDRVVASQALSEQEVDEALGQLSDPACLIMTPAMFAAWGRTSAWSSPRAGPCPSV